MPLAKDFQILTQMSRFIFNIDKLKKLFAEYTGYK